jgi:hypothetical protein
MESSGGTANTDLARLYERRGDAAKALEWCRKGLALNSGKAMLSNAHGHRDGE